MKFFSKTQLLYTLVLCSLTFFSLVSCKKDTVEVIVNHTDTVLVNHTDTVTVNVYTPITTAILTGNKWMIQEGRGVGGNSTVYYLRGGLANTANFDNEHYFFANGTVTHQENSGVNRQATWTFTNLANTSLVINFTNTPGNFNVYWDNIRLKNNVLMYDEYFYDVNTGVNHHLQFTRIAKQ